VLGMLSEEPLHGYAMRQRLGERAYDRLPGVKASSLYDAVRRMDAAGLIRADETGRAGNRPDRTRFVLTPDGREALDAWIEESLADDTDPDALPAALSFMYPLGSSRVIQVLRGRLERMSTALRMDDEELRHADSAAANPIFLSEHRYQLARRRAERDWLASFVAALEQSELTWPDAKPAATSTE
jgi:DNA-binding PadR family transcriptional regulator